MTARLSLLAAAALILAGCGSGISSGVVTSKEYQAPSQWTEIRCISYTKGMCTVYMPVVHDEPARWILHLRKGQDDGYVDVDAGTYDKTTVGDRYSQGTS